MTYKVPQHGGIAADLDTIVQAAERAMNLLHDAEERAASSPAVGLDPERLRQAMTEAGLGMPVIDADPIEHKDAEAVIAAYAALGESGTSSPAVGLDPERLRKALARYGLGVLDEHRGTTARMIAAEYAALGESDR